MQIEDRQVKQRISPQLKAFLAPPEELPLQGDSWSVHGIWAPGVRLMRNLRFQSKAVLITALFLIPILLLFFIYYSTMREQIAVAQAEATGVRYLKNVIPLTGQLLNVRKQHVISVVGGAESPDLRPARDAVTQTLQKLDAADAADGKQLGTAKALSDLKAAIGKAAGASPADVSATMGAYTPVFEALNTLTTTALDTSGLTLDPAVDTYYLMDVSFVRLPELMENTGRIRGVVAGLNKGAPRSEALSRFRFSAEAITDYVDTGFAQGIEKVVALHPDFAKSLSSEAGRAAMHLLHDKSAEFDSDSPSKPNGGEVVALGDKAIAGFVDTQSAAVGLLEKLLEERVSDIKTSLLQVSFITLISLVLTTYAFLTFYTVTKGGMNLISKHLQEMSSGDLRKLPRKPLGTDEAAGVIMDLRVAYESLHMLIKKVRHSARALHSAAGEISAASFDLGGRTEASAASLEEQASAMEEIGSTVQLTAQQASHAATFAVDNANVAEKGGAVFGEVVNTMREIHTSSSQIGDIIGVIDGIAFQTNILALNAAVEAARAGEAGRGFAVVASEVRTLAQRSAGAAREIKTLISASVERVEGGTRVVEAAGQTMNQVVTNAKQINTFLAEIATAAKEQALGVSEVGRAIQELDKNTQQNAALVEETNAAAGALTAQADELQAEIANFRVA